ncbi:Guanosine-3',5'-bis(diphosphate) 3'-pyrophosphohydrolase MESH1, partial [Xenoophorus captivus]
LSRTGTQAALLHDTVEDTDTTSEELEAKFGPIVTHIVQEVTDDKRLPKQERKRLQVEHAPHCSQQAKLVKLADKLYNLRDLNACVPVGQHLFALKLKLKSFICGSCHCLFYYG